MWYCVKLLKNFYSALLLQHGYHFILHFFFFLSSLHNFRFLSFCLYIFVIFSLTLISANKQLIVKKQHPVYKYLIKIQQIWMTHYFIHFRFTTADSVFPFFFSFFCFILNCCCIFCYVYPVTFHQLFISMISTLNNS